QVLARYHEFWKKNHSWKPELAVFQRDLLLAAASEVSSRVLRSSRSAEEVARLFSASGLGPGLARWAERHFDAVMKDGLKTAATGLNAMERQGRWSSWLNGLGWLVSGTVFFLHSMPLSLAAM